MSISATSSEASSEVESPHSQESKSACPMAEVRESRIPRSQIPFNPIRRRDRAVQDELWIHDLLGRAPVGTLATSGDRGPSLNPNLFVFDPEDAAVYLHTANKGHTRSNLEKRPRVAFSVAEMGRLLPAEQAVNFSVEFASVILEGPACVVDDAVAARRALDLFMRKYAPHLEMGKDYGGVTDRDLARTSVIKIEIERWSAKGKTSDAEDAYEYEDVTSRSLSAAPCQGEAVAQS